MFNVSIVFDNLRFSHKDIGDVIFLLILIDFTPFTKEKQTLLSSHCSLIYSVTAKA